MEANGVGVVLGSRVGEAHDGAAGQGHSLLHGRYRLFDVGGAIGLAGMTIMLIYFTAQNTYRLYQRERLE